MASWSFSTAPITTVSFHPIQTRLLACDAQQRLYVVDFALHRLIWSDTVSSVIKKSRRTAQNRDMSSMINSASSDLTQDLFRDQFIYPKASLQPDYDEDKNMIDFGDVKIVSFADDLATRCLFSNVDCDASDGKCHVDYS